MFSSSQLTGDQKQSLQQWAEEGASIADLQRQLKETYNLTITYMDARFMVLDLGIQIQEETKEEEETGPVPDEVVTDAAPEAADGVGVSVGVDEIAIPGALVSGRATFSDGQGAVWMIDEMGRPALDPDTPGYRPSREDIESFQKQLGELLRRQGM